MKLRCLIIDDEELARNILEAYSRKNENVEVMGKCKSVKEAKAILEKRPVDLMFLDIHMPGMNGLDFLRQLNNPPKVIFTTAFSQYALESYDLGVVDYLLKPIGFARFRQALDKANTLLMDTRKARAYEKEQDFDHQFLTIKEGYDHHRVQLKNILYVKAMQEYSAYYTSQGRIMELKTLSKVEQTLPDSHFMRIHRSYLVAKDAIEKHIGNQVLLQNGYSVPIGKTYRQRVLGELFA